MARETCRQKGGNRDAGDLVLATPEEHNRRGWYARTSTGHRASITYWSTGARLVIEHQNRWGVAFDKTFPSVRAAKAGARRWFEALDREIEEAMCSA